MRRRELKVSLGGSLGPAAFCTKGRGSSEPPLCISSIDAVHIVPVSDTECRNQPWRMTIRRTGRLLAGIDAGDQFHPARPSAAAVVAHASDDVADQHVAPRRARLGQHPLLAAANAGNAHEPRREGTEWFTQSFLARRQREIATPAANPGHRDNAHGGPQESERPHGQRLDGVAADSCCQTARTKIQNQPR